MTTLLSRPALSGLAQTRDVVGAGARVALWSLTDRQLTAEIADALALRAQADAVLVARLGEAEARDLPRTRGATSTVAWLRGTHRLSPGEASRLVKTARALREQLPATAQAMADGTVQLSQAEVIVDSLKDLSAAIAPDQRAEGEATLIGACATLDPVGLGRLGRRLEELLDPEGVQERDEAKIRDHEAKAFGKREFTLSPDPYGSAGAIRGRYDAEGAAIIAAALDSLSAPQPETPEGEKDGRSPAQRLYDALLEVLRRSLHHPATGSGDGGRAQIRVTIPLQIPDRPGRARGAGLRGRDLPDPGPDAGLRRGDHPRRPGLTRPTGGCGPGTPPVLPVHHGSGSKSETAAVSGPAAHAPPPGVRSTTSCPGASGVARIRPTGACSAGRTTARSNPANGRPSTITAGSGCDHQPASTPTAGPEST